jgi:CBS domain-containing protein
MAIVGPLTSLVLGAIFLILGGSSLGNLGLFGANPTRALSNLGPVSTLLLWLGPINILLGIFNMIPGFPLDGGRVLRSILWAITNDLKKATRWSTWVGQFVAWLFIAAGIAMIFGVNIPFFGTGLISGLWIAFIGWFLFNAAAQSYQQVVIQDMLDGVPVSRLMRSQIPAVTPDVRVDDLVYNHIMGTDERAFPVMDGGNFAGMVCLEDVRKVPKDQWDDVKVGQIMTPADKLDVISPREEASEALQKLARRDVNQVPVVQNGALVGILRRSDIIRWLQLQSDFGRS